MLVGLKSLFNVAEQLTGRRPFFPSLGVRRPNAVARHDRTKFQRAAPDSDISEAPSDRVGAVYHLVH
jgi:hypothetical protein